MATIQNNDLRYIKRSSLNEEANVVGNYMRDLIHQYGVDCIYHKLNTTEFNSFKTNIDHNSMLKRAYGVETEPDYSMSANMITYVTIDSDVFQLNKLGLQPQLDVQFAFDSTDFACALAPKIGQYKEYKVKETEIICEVPDYNLSDEASTNWPYTLKLGANDVFQCGVLSGNFRAIMDGYEYDKEQTIVCDPYEHTDFNITFPANNDLYYSLKHKIENDDYLETMLFLTGKVTKTVIGHHCITPLPLSNFDLTNFNNSLKYIQHLHEYVSLIPTMKIRKVDFTKVKSEKRLDTIVTKLLNDLGIANDAITSLNFKQKTGILSSHLKKMHDEGLIVYAPTYKNIFSGHLHGSVLFYDIDKLGKYVEMIHPEVGDVVEIDFPDEHNREKYEITECFDKQLTTDGINPLLHKYIWKCKARRYINSYEDSGLNENEADERIVEKQTFDSMVQEEVANQVSFYPDNEDSAYGGYEGVLERYDKQEINTQKHYKLDFLDEGTAIDLVRFSCGSRLVTTGYELVFLNSSHDAFYITTSDTQTNIGDACFEQELRYLKATDSQVVFVNILGESFKICEDDCITDRQLELCINDLYEKTIDTDKSINKNGDSFYKFKGTRTYLFATCQHLFCRLASNHKTYMII